MGFEEIQHTADWSLHVWANDLPSLFVESAQGMNWLAGARQAQGPKVKREYEFEAADAESLLVSFLTELVYAQEQENLMFELFDVEFSGNRIHVNMEGAHTEYLGKAIKAVTYHNLKIVKTENGFETTIVFDV
jgi:SHS2 domain-containing protein